MLLSLSSRPYGVDPNVEIEIRMVGGGGWISGRATRVEREASRWWVAIEIAFMDPRMRERLEEAIDAALSTAARRPVLVLDDRNDRRMKLVEQLTLRGLTPVIPKTPLEAMDYLTRPQLHVDVCVLGGSAFDLSTGELAAVLADTFPWVRTTTIEDDVDAAAQRAFDAWTTSPVARITAAIG